MNGGAPYGPLHPPGAAGGGDEQASMAARTLARSIVARVPWTGEVSAFEVGCSEISPIQLSLAEVGVLQMSIV